MLASALALMVGLASCSKDAEGPLGGGSGPGNVAEGIPTYASVTLSQNTNVGTYAANDPNYVTGNSQATENEKKIASAYVLIFDKMGVLERTEQLTDAGGGIFSATFPITTGEKKCFAVANIPVKEADGIKDTPFGAILTGFAKGTPYKLDAVRSTILSIASIAEATDIDDGFYMGNVYKLGATDEETHIIEQATQEEVTAQEDPKNNITIYIGRMVSKVTPKFTATDETQIGGKLSDLTYRVRNNPKRFYLFPVYGKDDKQGDVLTSPYFAITNYNWAEPTDKYDDGQLTLGSFFSNNAHADGATVDATSFVAFETDSYMSENSPKEPQRRKATMLSIRGKWTPNKDQVLDGNGVATGKDLETAGGSTFCRVQIINEENNMILGYLPGVYDVAEAADVKIAWKETIGDEAGKLTMQEGGKLTGQNYDGKTVTYQAVKYDQGICYYGYWLKQNINGASVAQMYAIKRNNHYNVSISSVDGPGDPTEDDVLNKEDEVEADSYMKATIEVLNWNAVAIEGGI